MHARKANGATDGQYGGATTCCFNEAADSCVALGNAALLFATVGLDFLQLVSDVLHQGQLSVLSTAHAKRHGVGEAARARATADAPHHRCSLGLFGLGLLLLDNRLLVLVDRSAGHFVDRLARCCWLLDGRADLKATNNVTPLAPPSHKQTTAWLTFQALVLRHRTAIRRCRARSSATSAPRCFKCS